MKVSEYRAKNPNELQSDLEALLKEQFNLRMQKGSGQLDKPHQMREVRKDIARIKTVLNEKKVGESS